MPSTGKVLGRLRAAILKMSCLNGNGTLDKVETILKSSCAVMVCLALMGLLAAQTASAEWMEQDKIAASDAAPKDNFGNSVSISGDYALVAAYTDDHSGKDDPGSAYIFKRDGTSWSQQAKIIASDPANEDLFGYSVSISGDYAIVGAIGDNQGGTSSGAAYIFKRDGASWTRQAKLTASDPCVQDYFGNSVSISGDYAIIGVDYDNHSGMHNVGAAYIFKRDGDDWAEQSKLIASDAAADDHFGRSVSISGDYVVIGAYRDDDDASNSGSAYIFKHHGEHWTQQAKLIASDAEDGDLFGSSASISGDYVVIGAHRDDDVCVDSGSAYIFKRDGDDWTQQVKLTASDTGDRDFFGQSVSISGNHVIVGAYSYPFPPGESWDDRGGVGSGSAYIFKRDGDDWTQQAKLTASDAAAYDFFGWSVSISGNYAVVGATGNDDDGTASGSAYIYINAPPGDADLDSDVDADDLGILAMNYGTSSGMTWSEGDFDGDGDVDGSDLATLAINYGSGQPTPGCE